MTPPQQTNKQTNNRKSRVPADVHKIEIWISVKRSWDAWMSENCFLGSVHDKSELARYVADRPGKRAKGVKVRRTMMLAESER